MRVYKFGGASVKDSKSIQNVVKVLQETDFSNGIMVISAMGKTTNAMEKVVESYIKNKDYTQELQQVKDFHLSIVEELFPENHTIFSKIGKYFQNIETFITHNKSTNYNFIYDQIVPQGELISTQILSAYLNTQNISNEWIDIRKYLKTNNTYREGRVDWKTTEKNLKNLDSTKLNITQGFLGSDGNNFNVTLGREGSDYTAAIIAYCLEAESLTIWKDVDGVLNADPRYFTDAKLLHKISYQEAVEMAFYGASVIHPKTLKPLENKQIPFYVKSFLNPKNKGTLVSKGIAIEPYMSCYIRKEKQILVSISPKDFSFISENHVSEIFNELSACKLKVTLMQVSAISLSVCVEDKFDTIEAFKEKISTSFKVESHKNVSLYTVRHFNDESKKNLRKGKTVLLEQIVKETLQMVTQE